MALIESRPHKPLFSWWQYLSLLLLVFHIGLIAYYYPNLPAEIPKHYGASGQPDAWGSKGTILLLPILGVILFVMMYGVQKLNLPMNTGVVLTEENSVRQTALAHRFLQITNAFVQILFLYISYGTIQIATGNATGMGKYSVVIILLVSILGPVIYMIIARRKANTS